MLFSQKSSVRLNARGLLRDGEPAHWDFNHLLTIPIKASLYGSNEELLTSLSIPTVSPGHYLGEDLVRNVTTYYVLPSVC